MEKSVKEWASLAHDLAVHLDCIDRSTFEFVLRYLYADTEERLFDEVRTKDLDDFIDLLLDVQQGAMELSK
jgi:hypothetical protein